MGWVDLILLIIYAIVCGYVLVCGGVWFWWILRRRLNSSRYTVSVEKPNNDSSLRLIERRD